MGLNLVNLWADGRPKRSLVQELEERGTDENGS